MTSSGVAPATKGKPRMPSAALAHMDMMRGIAAIAVLVGHVRGLFFVDLPQIQSPSALLRVLYLATGFGHQAVVVFFVLSGFFIATSVLSSNANGTWSWRNFMLRRFTRLYVVLVPALLLTACIDLLGMRLFGTETIYSGHLHAPFIQLFDARHTVRLPTLLGNLAFVQYVFVDPYGTNGPLWSLGFEFWSYVLFPLLVLAALRRTPIGARALYVGAAGVILAVGGQLAFYFVIWLFGAAVAFAWHRVRAHPSVLAAAGALALFFAALLVGRSHVLGSSRAEDVVLGIATSLLLLVLLVRAGASPAPGGRFATYARAASLVAGFSYTLYLVHFPIVAFVNAALIHVERWQPSERGLAFGVGLSAAILVFAYGLARVTEARTESVREWIERLGSRARSPRSARQSG